MERKPLMGYACSYCGNTYINSSDAYRCEENCKMLSMTKPCSHCDGKGVHIIRWRRMGYDGSPIPCGFCHGSGREPK